MTSRIPLFAALVAGCSGAGPRTNVPPAPADAAASDPLEPFLESRMQTAHVPGLAAVVVRAGEVVLARGFGAAELSQHRPVTPDTLFMLASISKTVTAVALLQLYEQGRFALDDAIDANLGYSVRNPAFPDRPLTYRMLLSHTSSIEDGQHFGDYNVADGDSPIPLDEFVHGYLVPGGAYYDATNWNPTAAPGTHYSYSNTGLALAGNLVEKISGLNLQDYCKQHVFAPLAMDESSFFLRDLDRSHIAMPYSVGPSGAYAPDGYYGYPDYPAGRLRTSASQLARFLQAIIGHGEYRGTRILGATTVDEMLRMQPSSEEGLSWESIHIGGHRMVGHSGADMGVATDMYFDPMTGAGLVVLTNGDAFADEDSALALHDIDTELLARGEP